ncbi:MAG: NAD-dependent epimerase/dehydratase family protein [Anaerolineae bacterium]|jgi:dihydroflavonol-4-reductase
MRAMVTGASGHVGANLVRALLAHGDSVRALVHRDQQALVGLPIEMVEGDVRDAASLARAFAGVELVYHVAGYISIVAGEQSRLHDVNVVGTRNVVKACLQCGVRRLVHFSSIHALDLAPDRPQIDETMPLVADGEASPYSLSKVEGERAVREGMANGLDAVILNPTAILGPHDYGPSHQGEVLLALARGRLPALVEGGFDWVDARDVAQGAIAAAERAPAGERYILSGHWASVRELASLVGSIRGVQVPRFVSPMWLARLGAPLFTAWARLVGTRPLFTSVALDALSSNRRISCAKAAAGLGYRSRPLRDTLVDTFRWFTQAGWLEASEPGVRAEEAE